MRISKESEEILQALFSMEEEDSVPAAAEAVLARSKASPAALDEAVRGEFVMRTDAGFVLSETGRDEASVLARRHRLAERMLHDVLRVTDEAIETTACEFEHFLEAEVVKSICTLLGHPKVCPHGKPIPPGECCGDNSRDVGPIVETLSEFCVGDSGAIAYIHTLRPGRLDRLTSFGLVPGTVIAVRQKWPSVVIALGETELALDRETAADIFVRRNEATTATGGRE